MQHILAMRVIPTELLGVKLHLYLRDYGTNLEYQDEVYVYQMVKPVRKVLLISAFTIITL